MRESLAEALAASSLSPTLAQSVADAWDRAATRREFAAHDVLFAPEDPATVLYVIAKGRIKLTAVSGQGKELILALLGPGEIVGELSFGAPDHRRYFAEAIEPVVAWAVPAESVQRIVQRDQRLALALLEIQGHRRQLLEQRLADLTFKEVPQRLASALIDFRETSDNAVRLTHYDLAGLIGSTRETTTMVLNRFREHGWVQLEKRLVQIVDMPALEDVAHGRADVKA